MFNEQIGASLRFLSIFFQNTLFLLKHILVPFLSHHEKRKFILNPHFLELRPENCAFHPLKLHLHSELGQILGVIVFLMVCRQLGEVYLAEVSSECSQDVHTTFLVFF